MNLGMKLIMCWALAIAAGGTVAGTMVAANDADMAYQHVAAR